METFDQSLYNHDDSSKSPTDLYLCLESVTVIFTPAAVVCTV